MSERVLSTEQAKSAIHQIQSIINGGLESQCGNLKGQIQTLSDPNVWDGNLATQFRTDTGPQCSKSLDATLTALRELHQELSKIATNIMTAGGNAA